ncbi:MAG: type IVB secretion system protein IcmJDotN [Gammaproteobacteria bacterium]
MQLLPIHLTAERGNWHLFMSRKRNKRFLEFEKKILEHDEYTCCFCGFQAFNYQSVINHDNNYKNNNQNNLVTACPFCRQCFFLDALTNPAVGGGYIIYLPEINQADLNNFCRVLFSCLLKNAPYKGKLQTTYLSFKDRTKQVEELFGPGSSNPAIFGQTLIDSNLTPKERSHPILTQIRLLPERKFFEEQILYWKTTVFDKIPL